MTGEGDSTMPVDSFKYLPRSIAAYYRNMPVQKLEHVPFTPLPRPLSESRFALVTTAGVTAGDQPRFGQEGERRSPMSGDATDRHISRYLREAEPGAAHR